MNGHSHSRAAKAVLATTALLFAGAAAASNLSDAQARYKQERAVCMSGKSNQDRATCLKEAAAALQEARRGNLSSGSDTNLGLNRMVRCEALPVQDREDCALRMQQGATSGSAQQGGILRESTRTVPSR